VADVVEDGYGAGDERWKNEMVKINEIVKWVVVELNRVHVVRDGGDDARAAEDDDVSGVRAEIGNSPAFD